MNSSPLVTLRWVAGPDAGDAVTLGPGRWLVGRRMADSPLHDGAAVGCADPTMQPHHALIEVDDAGAATMLRLTGTEAGQRGRWIALRAGEPHLVGASMLVLHPGGQRPSTAIGGVVQRQPRQVPTRPPTLADRDVRAGRDAGGITGGGDDGRISDAGEGGHLSDVSEDGEGSDGGHDGHGGVGPAPTRERPGGLFATFVALAGSLALALIVRQPMFVVFGLVGSLAAFASWGAQWLSARRTWRAACAEHSARATAHAQRAEQAKLAARRYYESAVFTLPRAIGATNGHTSELWARRANDGDAWLMSLGVELDPLKGDAGATTAVAVGVHPGQRLAVRGDRVVTDALIRSLIVQLASAVGPADVRVVVITADQQRWIDLPELPHLRSAGGRPALVDPREFADWWADHRSAQAATCVGSDAGSSGSASDGADQVGTAAHTVIITDDHESVVTCTSALRRAIDPAATAHGSVAMNPAVIVGVTTRQAVPQLCTSLVEVAEDGRFRFHHDTRSAGLPTRGRIAGLSSASLAAVVRRMARCIDPEDAAASASRIPDEVDLVSLLIGATAPTAAAPAPAVPGPDTHDKTNIDSNDIDSNDSITRLAVSAWTRTTEGRPRTRLGVAASGVVDIDLVRDGPHALLAGTTGAGKSELLRSLLIGLASNCRPEQLAFVLIDYKGGAAFDAVAALPHVVAVVTDLDDGLASRALRSLHAELRRRERLLREAGATDLDAFRDRCPQQVLPRLLIVVDEFAALANEQPAFIPALVGVAQRGRSLGVHLLLATQRPAGVISDDIRANTNLRIALRLPDAADALDVVGDSRPARVGRHQPGRALMRLGDGEFVAFQAARCRDVPAVVGALNAAAQQVASCPPPRPWLPPLPEVLLAGHVARLLGENGAAACSGGVLGVVDEPDHQRQSPLQWDPATGHLALIGPRGSGVTTTIGRLCAHVAHRHTDTELYVLDARGGASSRVASSPAVVVDAHDAERRHRLLMQLRGRLTTDRDTRPVVLFVDGIGPLRALLDTTGTLDEFDAFDELVHRGPQRRVTVVMAAEQVGELTHAHLGACAHRWLFSGLDRGEARSLIAAGPTGATGAAGGFSSADAVDALGGQVRPGRIVIASTGDAAQVALAHPLAAIPCCPHAESYVGADEVDILPAWVSADELAHAAAATRRSTGDDAGDETGNGNRVESGDDAGDESGYETRDRAASGDDAGYETGVETRDRAASGDRGLAVGVRDDTLTVAQWAVDDHSLVIGPPRSGRSSTLVRMYNELRAEGRPVVVLTPRRSPLERWTAPVHTAADAVAALACTTGTTGLTGTAGLARTPGLTLLVDDADLVDDSGGHLAAIAASGTAAALAAAASPVGSAPTGGHVAITIIAATKPDNLRHGYGHWTAALRRTRRAIMMTGCTDVDGDLVGVMLPARGPGAGRRPRPGLAWLVEHGDITLAQIAVDDPARPRHRHLALAPAP